MMARKFKELEVKMSPQRRKRVKEKAQAPLEEMLLAEIRREMGMTQTDVADELGIRQPSLSKLETQSDMQISTLRRIIEALGGELELVANLPGGRIRLTQFREGSQG